MSQWYEDPKPKPFDADEDGPRGWTEPAPAEPLQPYAAEEIVELEDQAPEVEEEEEIVERPVVEAEPVIGEPEVEEDEGVEEPEQPEPEEPEEPQPAAEHVVGGLRIPDGYRVLEGEPRGDRRSVAVAVSRFNGEITTELLTRALAELERNGVDSDAITIMPVPGAFELPLAAMALAKTRRYACVLALGCVIRGETPHFEYVANEAASGLQLAALETGTPVSFGVLTCENEEQARARLERGADAARSALEMAEVFSKLRAAAASSA